MVDSSDWRLQGQEENLKGVTLYWKKYKARSVNWDHDHCEFCWAKFGEFDSPDILHEGYTTEDEYSWICNQCFDDFKIMFNWKVEIAGK